MVFLFQGSSFRFRKWSFGSVWIRKDEWSCGYHPRWLLDPDDQKKGLLDHDNGDNDDAGDDDDNHDKQLIYIIFNLHEYLGTFRLPRRKAALDAMKPKAHLVWERKKTRWP